MIVSLQFESLPTGVQYTIVGTTYTVPLPSGMLMSGFTVFTPKFIESQFSIPAGWAAQLVGFATIPAGGGGTFLGGYIVKRFDLRCTGIIRWCMCSSFASFMFLLVFLIQCTALPFAGVSVDYTQVNAYVYRSCTKCT